MGIGRGQEDLGPTWILTILAKKIVFLVSSGKKQPSPLLTPLENFWKNALVPPLKNPSDGHVHVGPLGLYFSTFIAYLRYKTLLIWICAMHQEINKSERFMHAHFGQLKHDALAFQAEFTLLCFSEEGSLRMCCCTDPLAVHMPPQKHQKSGVGNVASEQVVVDCFGTSCPGAEEWWSKWDTKEDEVASFFPRLDGCGELIFPWLCSHQL